MLCSSRRLRRPTNHVAASDKASRDFYQPFKEDEFEQSTEVAIMYPVEPPSTEAANKLEQAGYENIACITSGLQSVKPGTFDQVGSTELQNAGKAGLVTIQGKISTVLETVLICAYIFITFFPDQAEKLFQLALAS